MGGYSPIYIKKYETGLVQNREEFILPSDAYPTLENAFVWRERIKRKQGYRQLGQLKRDITAVSLGVTPASPWDVNTIYSNAVPPISVGSNAQLELGSTIINIGGVDLFDDGRGNLENPGFPTYFGTINYTTGRLNLTFPVGPGVPVTATFSYFPGLPVMGIRTREVANINDEDTIFFDTTYAYRYVSGFFEFIPGTVWTGSDSDFFWTTNYWIDDSQRKIFWATNFSGTTGDPIRYTNGVAWADFAPQIDASGNVLAQCLCMVPFRGRMVTFNTYEGANLALSQNYTNRIRWAAIGNPFTTVDVPTGISVVNADAWRDDIPGQGGFLDIPTSEDIISVGFVRDNLVIYCERSTWQLRYTGRSIAPFQVEKVNSELGTESTFSSVQFDTSLVGVGNRGIVQCDSFKSSLIDVKIPDLVFSFNNDNNGVKRVHGIRDFVQRLAYWIYPYIPVETPFQVKYPNRRLVYNYENDSWAIFTDSFTALGTFQPQESEKWEDYLAVLGRSWEKQNYSWRSRPAKIPLIVAGNQHGFILELDYQTVNEPSLMISNLTGSASDDPAIFTIFDHNIETGQIVELHMVPFLYGSGLNRTQGQANVLDKDNITIYTYNPDTTFFDIPVTIGTGTYKGGSEIAIIDNFRIVSKKFNFAEDGQNIQMGYMDILMNTTSRGEITMNVYLDYNNNSPVNTLPENTMSQNVTLNSVVDPFFNTVITTNNDDFDPDDLTPFLTSKEWRRVFCPVRGPFITLEFTLSNSQMVTIGQYSSDVQIDAQILWVRRAGRQLPSVG